MVGVGNASDNEQSFPVRHAKEPFLSGYRCILRYEFRTPLVFGRSGISSVSSLPSRWGSAPMLRYRRCMSLDPYWFSGGIFKPQSIGVESHIYLACSSISVLFDKYRRVAATLQTPRGCICTKRLIRPRLRFLIVY